MLIPVKLRQKTFQDYKPLIETGLYNEVLELADKLKGKRILQINSSAVGGGVAEILNSSAPLLCDLGMNSHWQVLEAGPELFNITTKIHNGLQGTGEAISGVEWETYFQVNRQAALELDSDDWDLIVVHDPQPAAIPNFFHDSKTKWIWRFHADCSHPNPSYSSKLIEYLKPYDGGVFSLENYALQGFTPKHLAYIPVAIDPLSIKNLPMEKSEALQIVSRFGIDTTKPLVVQVSRFDRWKDPMGVIAAWEIARKELPQLQLALVGNSAKDNVEGAVILDQVRQAAKDEPGIFVIADKATDRDIKAFFTTANVVLQKSLREGFGLTVAEALWSGTPVIGSEVGGIIMQITQGQSGYLTKNVEETAKHIVELIENKPKALAMGIYGHEQISHNFLLPRLIRDDLKFWLKVLS